MKWILKIVWIVGIFYSSLFGQELTGPQIIDQVNEIMSPSTSYGKMQMTIITTSGDERSFIYESWSKDDGEKNLVRYLEPKRVKGQATLMLNHADDIWMYFPRTKRVRKLASHAKKQKMQGSDFSYEDMGSGDSFIEDFTAKRLADENVEDYDCYKLEMTRNEDSDISYSRLEMWVIKDLLYPVAIQYYDEDDPQRHIKRLVQRDIKKIDGVPTAGLVTMYNIIDNTYTEMKLLEVTYDIELDDKMFTERELKK